MVLDIISNRTILADTEGILSKIENYAVEFHTEETASKATSGIAETRSCPFHLFR